MTSSDIARLRLHNQHIAGATFEQPGAVVAWLGAVQAQDYLGSLWAVGLRMRNAVEADIERALADGTIIRTWPMRGTLHFVAGGEGWRGGGPFWSPPLPGRPPRPPPPPPVRRQPTFLRP